ncbi:hypothetical protein GH714_021341 [Hevea brasiliensis]|uniref:Uncharacterized protein n=1 Tax=Hevea brasiliensis TaxID=3981 RepID=A0A6A6LCH3_HEVBR|nr:hypothetical protein GH714_021341 [Hevea brasiliensis]
MEKVEEDINDEACELVNGVELSIGKGADTISAYLFKAVKNNNGTGILLLSDVFGFEDSSTRDFAYRVACNGYKEQRSAMLSQCLERYREEHVSGSRVVVFQGRGHGFAHRPNSPEEDRDAEQAFVLMRNWLYDGLGEIFKETDVPSLDFSAADDFFASRVLFVYTYVNCPVCYVACPGYSRIRARKIEFVIATASTVVGEIAKTLVAPVGQSIGYLIYYHCNIKNLEEELQKLVDKKITGVDSRVDDVKRNLQVVAGSVIHWQEEVDYIDQRAKNFLKM